jgi:hypothetical protein
MTNEQAAFWSNTVNGCIAAGLQIGNPHFQIYDPNGGLTGLNPCAITPDDLIALALDWFGDDIALMTAGLPQLTIH